MAHRGALAVLATLAMAMAGCGESDRSTTPPNAQAGGTKSHADVPSVTGRGGSRGLGSGADKADYGGIHHRDSRTATTVQSAPSAGAEQPVHRRRRAHLVLPGPNSRPAPHMSTAQRANVSVADIALSSSAIAQPGPGVQSVVARRYTCQGADTPPPLRWTGVPTGTKELALFVLNTRPVHEKLFFDWAVTGLPGGLRELEAGSLPAGAVVGRNGFGHDAYSLCPLDGRSETYLFVLYALPQKLSAVSGFDPTTMRAEAIKLAHHTGILFGAYG